MHKVLFAHGKPPREKYENPSIPKPHEANWFPWIKRTPESITILVNQYVMDQLNDFQRTYVLVHEIGHTLGLAHTNGSAGCGMNDESIMNAGSPEVMQRTFNTPMPFDQAQLTQLYR